ncbi:Acyl-CoA N-acyltransferase [Amanita muscaria]
MVAHDAPVPAHEIIVAETLKDREKCFDVRIKVFIDEQGFPLEVEIDEYEDIATHLLLRLKPSLTPIGTIRVHKYADTPYYKLTRLAVLKEYRRYGFGNELVQALHERVRSAAKQAGQGGSVQIVAHTQIPAKGFYARNGYTSEGEEFELDGQPHQKMVIHLPLDMF